MGHDRDPPRPARSRPVKPGRNPGPAAAPGREPPDLRSSGRWPIAAGAAIVALGLALRLAGIRQGLPDFVEEAAPVRWALAVGAGPGGAVDWNPHHFIYPSLTLYLHLALQWAQFGCGRALGAYRGPADYHLAYQLDPTPMVLLARALGVAADVTSLVLVMRLGERMRRGAGV